MDQEPAEIIRAAGVILRAPDGSILMVKRVDDGSWAFPGGCIEGDETPEQCAWRETFEETGRRLGDVGKQLMRRVKDGVDFTTFISDVDAPFVPTLNAEHSAFAWVSPEETLMDNRADITARADSATPVVGGEGAALLAQSLEDGMLAEEAERVADQDKDLEDELGSAANEEGPDPMLETPAYPPPLADEGQDLLGEDEPDDGDLSDEDAELILSVIGDLEARLERLEEGVRD